MIVVHFRRFDTTPPMIGTIPHSKKGTSMASVGAQKNQLLGAPRITASGGEY